MTCSAGDQPTRSKPDGAFTEANRLDVTANVHCRRNGRDDEPLESYRLRILAAHYLQTADHKDGSERGSVARLGDSRVFEL